MTMNTEIPTKAANDFLQRSLLTHGDKYDYSCVQYVNARTPVKVICNRCGNFWYPTPYAHAKPDFTGTGCPFCAGHHRTTADFVRAARLIYGDRYDYSRVDYRKANDKVIVYCPKHDRQWKTTWHRFIISQHACSACGQEGRRRPLSKYIALFQRVHGDIYDYSMVTKWKGWHSYVPIICRLHQDNPFLQTPASHYYQKNGCPKCAAISRGIAGRSNTDEWISKARAVHGDRYEYTKAVYTKEREEIVVTCKVHGDFKQRAGHHLAGSGCNHCHFEQMAADRSKSYSAFVSESAEMHLGRYTYLSEPDNFSLASTITIHCPEHGAFDQNAGGHLYGSGCPRCKQSKGETEIMRFLMTLGIEFEQQKKFEGCVSIRPLPFDFYIEKLNLLIEFDGEQHYLERDSGIYAGKYHEIKKRDKIKDDFAHSAGINLLRILWDEDPEEALKQALQALD